MIIRVLREEDWQIWKDTRLEALRLHPENYTSSYEEENAYTEDKWRELVKTHRLFCAFLDGVVVGTTGFYILNQLKAKHTGVIYAVYVNGKFRGKGIARALMEFAIEDVKHEVVQIQLHCSLHNHNAKLLYEKLGFITYGIEPKTIKIGEHFYDNYLMMLNVSELPANENN